MAKPNELTLQMEPKTMKTYQIEPRQPAVGGGWSLKLLEDGQEMGGGVFPPVQSDDPEFDQAYQDALDEAQIWIGSAD